MLPQAGSGKRASKSKLAWKLPIAARCWMLTVSRLSYARKLHHTIFDRVLGDHIEILRDVFEE